PGGRLQDPPGLDARDPARAERFQPLHFRLLVVRLDVEMDPARMIDLLHQQDRLVGAPRELTILADGPFDGPAQGGAPEARRLVGAFRPAVDHERAQPAVMHGSLLSSYGTPA